MALTKVTSGMVNPDPTNASNLSSGDVPLAQLGNVPSTDTSTIEDDIALLAFKTQANGSLAKYNLVDQVADSFEDATGIDSSASTNARRDGAGKYYQGKVSANATGGTITSYSSGGVDYKVHNLANGEGLVVPSTGTVDFLIVGGGGGGRYGGGGAGGLVYGSDQSLTAATYPAVVGAGGPANTNGSDSSFNSFTAKGGGYGGAYNGAGGAGGNGGGAGLASPSSGVGGTSNQDAYSSTPNVTGYGTDNSPWRGGNYSAPNDDGSQGGAGAGAGGVWIPASHPAGPPGTNYDWPNYAGGGGGGNGLQYDITGTNLYYAGGGGGCRGDYYTGGAGGSGGGGQGNVSPGTNPAGTPGLGTDGLGGGGGGGTNGTGAAGGDGVVIVRYIEDAFVSSPQADMTLISTTATATDAVTKGDIVMTYTDSIGTATLNTDLKAYVSRDNGANYTEGVLVNQGTSGGHKIATFHNLTLSGTDTSQVRFKITTHNQSGSKETRVHAVSVGWS